MQHLIINFENEEFWLEVDDSGYALRQIVVSNDQIEISCRTDCLAEGIVQMDELAGEIEKIPGYAFECKWNEALQPYKSEWQRTKVAYPLGREAVGQIKYLYPQGAVIALADTQGLCPDELPANSHMGTQVRVAVTGYDETNLWLELKALCI